MGCLFPGCVFSLTQSDFDQYLGVILAAAGITKDKGIIQSYGKKNEFKQWMYSQIFHLGIQNVSNIS